MAFIPAASRVPAYNYSVSYSWLLRQDQTEYQSHADYSQLIASHAPIAALAPWDPAYQNLFCQRRLSLRVPERLSESELRPQRSAGWPRPRQLPGRDPFRSGSRPHPRLHRGRPHRLPHRSQRWRTVGRYRVDPALTLGGPVEGMGTKQADAEPRRIRGSWPCVWLHEPSRYGSFCHVKKTLHIDSTLLAEARSASRAASDTETVRLGLEALVRHAAYERLRALRGSEPDASDVPRRRAPRPPKKKRRLA
jgi:Arc/MetJ family transcription regulator